MVYIELCFKCPLCNQQTINALSPIEYDRNQLLKLVTYCTKCGGYTGNVNHEVKVRVENNVIRCHYENTVSFGGKGGALKTIVKQIQNNKRDRQKEYERIYLIILNAPPGTKFTIKNFVEGIEDKTQGELQRIILDLFVCQGFLEKKFMGGNTHHQYEKKVQQSVCPYFNDLKCGYKWSEGEATNVNDFNWRKD